MEQEGFLPVPLTDLVFFTEDGLGALAYLEEQAGVQPWHTRAAHTRGRPPPRPVPLRVPRPPRSPRNRR